MITKAYLNLPAGQMHYRMVSGDGPVIVLLHRTAASSVMYEGILGHLEGEYTAYAFDTPGFGESFKPDGSPAMTDYATWIAGALDALKIGSAHFFGHHTGSNIAAELALLRPDLIQSLMLMGVTWLDETQRETFRPMFQTVYEPRDDGSHLQQNWDWVKLMQVSDDALPAMHQEFLDTTKAYESRVQAFNAVWDQDTPGLLGKLTCPLLLMCAEDEMLYQYFPAMVQALPGASQATFRGGTFAPELDASSIAASIAAFVTSQSE
jgi:pimeloyl-ACP methyl ester carboxylesterase